MEEIVQELPNAPLDLQKSLGHSKLSLLLREKEDSSYDAKESDY